MPEPKKTSVRDRVTRQDVARFAGVSTAVVSYVVNDGPKRVAPDTAERVRRAIEVLRYQPNAHARALRLGSTNLLGIVVPDITKPFFAATTEALERAAAAEGYALLLADSASDRQREKSNIGNLVSRQVDGLVLLTLLTEPELATLSLRDTPAVVFNWSGTVPGFYAIGAAAETGAYNAVRHLVGHGHKDITLIMGARDPNRPDPRELGWSRAVREAKLEEQRIEGTDFTRLGGYQAMQRILASRPLPTAVYASSDLEAIGALRAMREAGVQVPEDIALASFDDIVDAEYTWPALTTVRLPIVDMATAAVAALIRGDTSTGGQLFDTQLVVRHSCGC
jgi:LacI family transcriptional regulator